jgi:DNA-binding FadR family transcriptional regulator
MGVSVASEAHAKALTPAEQLTAELRRRIVMGQLPVGTRLPPEPEMREELGVSRATLREAFRVLESDGLIAVQRGARGGAEVRHPSPESAARYFGLLLQSESTTIEDFQKAREVLEPPMAGMLARRRDKAAIAALEEALELERASIDDPEAHARAGVHFHDIVAEHCGSPTLAVLLSLMDAVIHASTTVLFRDDPRSGSMRRTHRSHEQLVELVRAGDATGAEELWAAHMRKTGAAMLAGVDAQQVMDLFP